MSRPVWFLDVDGVLNAVRHPVDEDGYRRIDVPGPWGRSWGIVHSPAIVARVGRLARDGSASVHWLTTWMDYAARFLAPRLGLPELPVAGESSLGLALPEGPLGWWKAHAVDRYLAGHPGVPLVWTDDDLDDGTALALGAAHPGTPTLLIAPSPLTGLTPGDLDRVEEFLRTHGGAVR